KKCLGKMNDVSKGQGRTVLFVSHNMSSVSVLCNTGIYLKNGEIVNIGQVNSIISEYMSNSSPLGAEKWDGVTGDESLQIFKTQVYSSDVINKLHTNADILIEIEGEILKPITGLILGFTLWSQFDYEIAYALHDDDENQIEINTVVPGKFIKKFRIPANTLADGIYRIQFDVGIHMKKRIVDTECDLSFTLTNISGIGRKFGVPQVRGRTSLIRTKWAI